MKKLYIWTDKELSTSELSKEETPENYPKLTERYHPGGGLIVICENLENIKETIIDYNSNLTGNWRKINSDFIERLPDPDHTYDIEASENKVFLFPDKGCC